MRSGARVPPWLADAVVCALSLALLALFVRDHAYSLYDDAFIYLRYVKNVRAGCGLRFNCDEPPVEGFSSPLYLGMLVAGGLHTHKLVTLAQILCAGTMGCVLVFAALGARTVGRGEEPRARGVGMAMVAAVGAALSLDGYVLLNAVTGMDTALGALAVLTAWLAVRSDRRVLATLVVCAAPAVRSEGVWLVLLLPLLPWARSWRVLAALGLSLLGTVLVRWGLFHDVLPNVVRAKAGGTLRHFELGARYVLQVALDFPAVLLAPLLLAAPSEPARASARYGLAVTGAWALMLAYAGGDTFEYSRLAFPLVPMLAVMGVQGAASLAERTWADPVRRRSTVAAGAVVCAVLAADDWRHRLPPMHGFDNVKRWTQVGKYLKATFPGRTIATVPAGAIPYFSELRTLDLVGLTSREVAAAHRFVPPELLERNWIGHERHDVEWTLAYRPDLLVTTRFRATPWSDLGEVSAGFYAEWLFLQEMKSGRAPYHVADLPIGPDLHWLAFARDEGR